MACSSAPFCSMALTTMPALVLLTLVPLHEVLVHHLSGKVFALAMRNVCRATSSWAVTPKD